MKKLLVFLLIVGAGGFLFYRYVLTSAPERSCQRLATLCGGASTGLDQCVRGVTELGQKNQEAVSKFEACVADAKSCGEGAGCLVGAGVDAAGSVVNDFLKGVGKALGK
jgi:hypothetical protein